MHKEAEDGYEEMERERDFANRKGVERRRKADAEKQVELDAIAQEDEGNLKDLRMETSDKPSC